MKLWNSRFKLSEKNNNKKTNIKAPEFDFRPCYGRLHSHLLAQSDKYFSLTRFVCKLWAKATLNLPDLPGPSPQVGTLRNLKVNKYLMWFC